MTSVKRIIYFCHVLPLTGLVRRFRAAVEPHHLPGKFFPIVEAEGDIRKEIFDAILTAFRNMGKQ